MAKTMPNFQKHNKSRKNFRLLLRCFCFCLEQICEDYSSSFNDSW